MGHRRLGLAIALYSKCCLILCNQGGFLRSLCMALQGRLAPPIQKFEILPFSFCSFACTKPIKWRLAYHACSRRGRPCLALQNGAVKLAATPRYLIDIKHSSNAVGYHRTSSYVLSVSFMFSGCLLSFTAF
jgi:hypothetical protein